MSRYSAKFKKIVTEDFDEELDNLDFSDEAKSSAIDDFADSDTNPDDLRATDVLEPDDEITAALDRKNQMMIDTIEEWISTFDEFLEYINGESEESIQSILAGAEPDTIMDKMKQSQQTKIARVASDVASLHQSFLGFRAQTRNAKFKYV